MRSLNRAQIIGNLTRDPELRNTATGQSVCSFGVATNRQYTDKQGQKQEQVEYHNITAWGKLAEICSQYLTKGKKVYVDGRLQTRDWDGKDGVKRKSTEVVIENMIMLSSGGGQGGQGGGDFAPRQAAPAAPQQAPVPQAEEALPTISYDDPGSTSAPGVVEQDVNVEDIPF